MLEGGTPRLDAGRSHQALQGGDSLGVSRVDVVERVQQAAFVLLRIRRQMALGAVDHLDVRPHPPGEREQGDPGAEAERRVRVPQVVDPPRWLDPPIGLRVRSVKGRLILR